MGQPDGDRSLHAGRVLGLGLVQPALERVGGNVAGPGAAQDEHPGHLVLQEGEHAMIRGISRTTVFVLDQESVVGANYQRQVPGPTGACFARR